jgi:adenine-specific DNA methylase
MNALQYPKRLIEVDLPIRRISAHARREKSIRHGHISTLHIWWARRPLASCRAVICAALWPDPGTPLEPGTPPCPQAFREAAARIVADFARRVTTEKGLGDKHCSPENWPKWTKLAQNGPLDPGNPNHMNALRGLLLDFIADFANWDNSTVPAYLETARALTQAAHEALGGEPGTRPLVVDPFAGGGSIPLEALRVGADAFASDLNPVAVLLNKVVLEYIPKYGQRLADEVRKWGAWIKEQAEKELAEFYPKDPDGATPIAYLWARTIRCEGPGCGAEVPLMRSLWLAKKPGRSVAMKLVPRPRAKRVDFQIVENVRARDVGEGTVARGSATCPVCGFTTPVASVRRQLKPRRGGAADARLFCVVTTRPAERGRFYRLPTERDLAAVRRAAEELERRKKAHCGEFSLVPDEPLPTSGSLGFRVQPYGMSEWGNLYAPRQALALTTLVGLARRAGGLGTRETGSEIAEATQTCLALAVDRMADKNASLTVWNTVGEKIEHVFGRQALPMTWDFPEVGIFSNSTGNWMSHVRLVAEVLGEWKGELRTGTSLLAPASGSPMLSESGQAVFTDPPYYDAVPYADLSDFFYVWLKRSLPSGIGRSLFSERLAPKEDECIVDDSKGKSSSYFESAMGAGMAESRRVLAPRGIGIVVFAHKSTGGWEAQLQAMIDAGWVMTGSWPLDTERPGRLRAQNSAALSSSIHLVCRPRENPDGSVREDLPDRQASDVGDWRDVLQELPRRIHDWMPRLAAEGVVGADAIFACLGPALEVFSRYSRVERASGEVVTLKEYLEEVWAAVAKEALDLIFEGGDATGFEPDARLTAMWLWTLLAGANGNGGAKKARKKSAEDDEADEDDEGGAKKGKKPKGGFALEYDAARKIAQGLGAHLERMGHVVEVKGSSARLLPVAERTKHLFGKDEAQAPRARRKREPVDQTDFLKMQSGEDEEDAGGWGEKTAPRAGATTLDRVHQGMILFASGRSGALKRFVVEDGAGRDPRFWKLAQALSALYPKGSEEKRWVDGVLAKKKGFGF